MAWKMLATYRGVLFVETSVQSVRAFCADIDDQVVPKNTRPFSSEDLCHCKTEAWNLGPKPRSM